MPISVSCPCGKTLSVKDELAGKRGKCPKCGAPLTIPQPPKPAELAPLDLPSLSDEFDQPAPAEVVPEAVRLARARSGWVDPSIETEFKLAGDPLSDDVGKVFAPPSTIAPVKTKPGVREEKEGEFVCPRCGCGLERTYSLLNILTMYASSYTTGFYLRPTTPYLCRVCDVGIRYEDLRGASRRTADRRSAKLKLGCLIAFLTIGGLFGGCYMAVKSYQNSPEALEKKREQQEKWDAEQKRQAAESEKARQAVQKLEEQYKEKAAQERQQREAERQRYNEEQKKQDDLRKQKIEEARKRDEEAERKREEDRKRAREEREKARLNPPPTNPFQPTD